MRAAIEKFALYLTAIFEGKEPADNIVDMR
jgi:hypothetical protein